jgi:hypothetical protein
MEQKGDKDKGRIGRQQVNENCKQTKKDKKKTVTEGKDVVNLKEGWAYAWTWEKCGC